LFFSFAAPLASVIVVLVGHPPGEKLKEALTGGLSMKKIAIAVALAVAFGGLGFATSADAAKPMQVNAKRFSACTKTVSKRSVNSPAFAVMVDQCYRGMPW
jgi:hypothetical protein